MLIRHHIGPPSLYNLAQRLKMNYDLLEKHPESSDMLNRKISETKEMIAKTVLKHCDNKELDRFCV